MRDLAPLRIRYGIENYQDDDGGAFLVTHRGIRLTIIASHGMGWDHVSVSTDKRCPTWEEMEHIKRLFFEDHEVCMQLHVAVKDHISCHPYTLHIWRPQQDAIPLPLPLMVA